MRKQLWFLTGTQSLYGPEVLDQVADDSRELARRLDAAGFITDVIWKPVLTDKEGIYRMILDANTDPACVGVIAWMHTFSPAKMWIAGLEALQVPLLHLHTQVNDVLPWATIDMDFMNLNQAAHGDREFGYLETRLGLARKTVSGSVTNPDVVHRVDTWARAAVAWDEGRHARLVRFGDNMRDVAVTEGDKVEAERVFGVSVNTYGVNDLVDAVAAPTDAEAEALAASYEDLYDVAPELRRGADRHDSLVYGARQELGLRSFLDEHDATA